MATVKATIKKRVTGGWDDIHPTTQVDQITDFDANVPANLDDLLNVDAASPSDGQALVWVGSPTNKWQPGTVAVDVSGKVDVAGDTMTGDLTLQYDGTISAARGSHGIVFQGYQVAVSPAGTFSKELLMDETGTLKFNGTAVSLAGHTHSYLPLAGGQMTGSINMGASDLKFEGADPGDIVWYNGSSSEIHRLWSGTNTLNYRTNAGTAYGLWHAGNLTNLNQLTNGPGYITSADGGNAATLDSIDSTQFLRSDTTDYYDRLLQNATGVPTNNLGSPSVTEMALFEQQFDNKTDFYPIANLKFYTSTNGLTWTEYTSFSDTDKRRFVGGDTTSGIIIPNATPYFRIELTNDGNYVYLNALYMYWSSNSHSTKVKIRKQRGDGVWSQHTDSNATVSSWPGHLYLPFGTIPFNPSTTSTGHYRTIHIDFIPTWQTSNPTYSGNNINLYSMQIWGGYPAGRRRFYSINENQQVYFPSDVHANNNKLATETYVDTAVSNLVDSAPGALNTLNELAAALGDDANFSTTVTNALAGKVNLSGGNTLSGNQNFYSTDTTGTYSNAAVEIREVNLVTTSQSSEAYAPELAFHWGGRSQTSIWMSAAGKLNLAGNQTGQILTTNEGKAVDSDKLDNLDSSQFLRSDADDTFTGKLSVGSTNSRSAGIYGTYDSYRIGHIWSMGTAYAIPNDGSSFGSLYGLAYTYDSRVYTSDAMAKDHQMVWTINGTPKAAMGANLWTAGNITTYGSDNRLGDGNNDSTWVNDTLYVGSSDSGDSHLYFGENSSNWYGTHWYWDSGYTHYWYTRNAGTDTELMRFATNSTDYVYWNRNFHIQNKDINYVNQLHFNDNVRFYDEGNDSYLRYKFGDTATGGIILYNGSDTRVGYIYSDGSGANFGLLNRDGQWAVRTTATQTSLYHDGSERIITESSRMRVATASGNLYMGAQNTSWAHFETDRPRFYFGKGVSVDGTLQDYSTGSNYWHASNDGSGSGLSADDLDGYHAVAFVRNAYSQFYDTSFPPAVLSNPFSSWSKPTGMPAVTLEANSKYYVQAFGLYYSSASTTGIGISPTFSTVSGTVLSGRIFILDSATTTGTTATDVGPWRTMSTSAGQVGNYILSTSAAPTTAPGQYFGFEGIIETSGNSTVLSMHFRSEVNGSQVNISRMALTAMRLPV